LILTRKAAFFIFKESSHSRTGNVHHPLVHESLEQLFIPVNGIPLAANMILIRFKKNP